MYLLKNHSATSEPVVVKHQYCIHAASPELLNYASNPQSKTENVPGKCAANPSLKVPHVRETAKMFQQTIKLPLHRGRCQQVIADCRHSRSITPNRRNGWMHFKSNNWCVAVSVNEFFGSLWFNWLLWSIHYGYTHLESQMGVTIVKHNMGSWNRNYEPPKYSLAKTSWNCTLFFISMIRIAFSKSVVCLLCIAWF